MKGLAEEQSKSVEHYTPPHLFQALGLRFAVDVASPVGPAPLPWVPAALALTIKEDGLTAPYPPGLAWCNPPYTRETLAWLKRIDGHPWGGVVLVFARTETLWAQWALACATTALYIRGRLNFVDAAGQPQLIWDKKTQKWKPGSAQAPSMLLAWGEEGAEGLRSSGLGHVDELAWQRRGRVLVHGWAKVHEAELARQEGSR